jgi:hypothetical protein
MSQSGKRPFWGKRKAPIAGSYEMNLMCAGTSRWYGPRLSKK